MVPRLNVVCLKRLRPVQFKNLHPKVFSPYITQEQNRLFLIGNLEDKRTIIRVVRIIFYNIVISIKNRNL